MTRTIAALALAFLAGAIAPGDAAVRAPLILKSSATPSGSFVPAGTYRLDRAHSRLTARIARAGQAPFTVRFERFDALFVYDPAQPQAARAEVTIDPASFTAIGGTRNGAAPDLRSFAKWRAVGFVSHSFQRIAPTRGVLTGNVSFFGIVRPMAIQLSLYGVTPGRQPMVGLFASSAISIANPALLTFTGLQLGGDMQFTIQAQFVKS